MRFFKMPVWLTNHFPQLTWQKSVSEKIIYLTFDDGPMCGVTEWVLDMLKVYDAKATFFCVGDNIRKNPDIFERVVREGHQVGNHTFNHLSGWGNDFLVYLDNIEKCQIILEDTLKNYSEELLKQKKNLFRPPYGKLTFQQINFLKQKYQIVMWDVLSYDFDRTLSPAISLQKTIQYTKNGSIVVFHDSYKSIKQLEWILPRYLAYFHHLGYTFSTIN